MSTATVSKYTAKRAEVLAELVLTRRKGARLLSFTEASDTGIDFIAQLPAGTGVGRGRQIQPYLNVQVRGTDDPLEDEDTATRYAKRHWKPLSFSMGPAVFLLFSMEGDLGYFSWMLEPEVDSVKGPSLAWAFAPEMTKITRKSIEDVFERTEQWFKAMSEVVIHHKSKQ